MTAEVYAAKVVAGELYDPTLHFQIENGFAVCGVLQNYVKDAATGGWSVLIAWENPELKELACDALDAAAGAGGNRGELVRHRVAQPACLANEVATFGLTGQTVRSAMSVQRITRC